MIVETGHYALALALAVAPVQSVLPIWGTRSRDAALAGVPPPASTLMVVSGFARPEFLVEVEAVAAG